MDTSNDAPPDMRQLMGMADRDLAELAFRRDATTDLEIELAERLATALETIEGIQAEVGRAAVVDAQAAA